MSEPTLFSHIKNSVKISDFVRTIPGVKGLHSVGEGRWRCNNVIAGGDNTNAMAVNDEDGRFKVYSHGQESGDIITLYALTMGGGESANNWDSAVALAQHMSIAVPAELMDKKSYSPTSRMMSVMDSVADHTHDYLMNSNDDDAVTAREYFMERGASKEMLEEWKLGMIPSDMSDALSLMDEAADGDRDALRKTGVLGGRRGDFVTMAGRITFPIFNPQGRCVSLSSRLIPGVETFNDSKYINTSSTPIYDKSSTLYGSHLLKRKIRQVIICEGNFDVIALNYATPDDVVAVATCGTALTEGHVDLLKKYKPQEVMVYFDADDAGRKSAAKSLWVTNHIMRFGIHSSSENDSDPWDVYSSHGDIKVDYVEPAPVTAARLMSQSFDREEVLSWYRESFKKLNFRDDRYQLTSAVSRYLGVKTSFLDRMTEDIPQSSSRRRHDTDGVEISLEVTSLIRALLSMDRSEREIIAFSLISAASSDKVMELCGVRHDDDRLALLTAFSNQGDDRISSYVYSLYPEPGSEDAVCRGAAQMIALSLLGEWRNNGIPSSLSMMIPAITNMSIGMADAPGKEQLDFILDMAATDSSRTGL